MSRTLTLLLAGIAIGILIAPDKGSATRQRLAETFEDLMDQAQDKTQSLVSEGKDKAKEIVSTLKKKTKDGEGEMKDKWD